MIKTERFAELEEVLQKDLFILRFLTDKYA